MALTIWPAVVKAAYRSTQGCFRVRRTARIEPDNSAHESFSFAQYSRAANYLSSASNPLELSPLILVRTSFEHVTSGRTATFHSPEALLEATDRVIKKPVIGIVDDVGQ